MHAHVHVYAQARTEHMYIYTTCMHTCMRARMSMCGYVCICIYMNMYRCIRICVAAHVLKANMLTASAVLCYTLRFHSVPGDDL